MKRWAPAILLIALWGVVLVILLTPEVPNGHGFQHSTFGEMDQGGNGADRHESLFIAGWMFGSRPSPAWSSRAATSASAPSARGSSV